MAKRSTKTALSVRQPWAWLLVKGYKDIENRTWSTNFRGRCLIHAGKAFDQPGYERLRRNFKHIKMPLPEEFQRGGIVGWVNITDCVTESTSEWFSGPYGFVIDGADELPFVPMPGKLGLFQIEEPIYIRVTVKPSVLRANSGQTARVTVQVSDTDGKPVKGIALHGETSPATLGRVTRLPARPSKAKTSRSSRGKRSGLRKTNIKGQSHGLWWAGSVPGRGLLIVVAKASGHRGEAVIMLVGEDDPEGPSDPPPGPVPPGPVPPAPKPPGPPSSKPHGPSKPGRPPKPGKRPRPPKPPKPPEPPDPPEPPEPPDWPDIPDPERDPNEGSGSESGTGGHKGGRIPDPGHPRRPSGSKGGGRGRRRGPGDKELGSGG